MTLPAPNLDDRRFQDLVDEAKRFVQQRCPEWSDHNVSDPGVTLIELFAQMTDQLVYRLNRVPERNYVKFLELIGLRRHPPTSAVVPVTFWLAAVPTEKKLIPAGTEVSTLRTTADDALEFTTMADAVVVPVVRQTVRSSIEVDRTRTHDDDLIKGVAFTCFSSPPNPGDALYVGLNDAAPSNAVVLTVHCSIDGIGVDPLRPPLLWEAWTGDEWTPCELNSDSTGGLNRNGEVILHLPHNHAASIIATQRAGWVRGRVIATDDDRPSYSASPVISNVLAHSIGATVDAIHAKVVDLEIVGQSDGTPGQRFTVTRRPIVRHSPAYLQVSTSADGEEGWQSWTEVNQFAESGPDDQHFVVDGLDGEVSLGPTVRQPDGSLRRFGAVPPQGATIQLRRFAVGGGAAGNVQSRAISVLSTSIPSIDRVENRRGGIGGRDGEAMEEAKRRAPLLLRSRGRAVTMEDFEELSKQVAPEVARVRCVAAGDDSQAVGGVRILVVPDVTPQAGRIRFEQLVPQEASLARIASELDLRRLIGTRVSVEPPVYQGVTVVARVRARTDVSSSRLQERAVAALYTYYSALEGGPDGTGWPFGRALMLGEVYAVLQRVAGLEMVEDARLFGADPISGQRGQSVPRIDIAPNALVFSYDHQVLVESGS